MGAKIISEEIFRLGSVHGSVGFFKSASLGCGTS